MAWILPFNSYLVSGFTILFFNFFVFSAVKTLCQSICASQNLHVIYDKRQPLEPRRSRFSSVFGGPTGPPLLARFFAVLIALFAVLVILLDFSVNGATRTSHVPTVYKSLVRAHPRRKPLVIDYAREYRVDDDENRFVSRRLVAVGEAHSCLDLNITHHAMNAYAFRDARLDEELIPISTFPKGGECVTEDLFDRGERMHIFEQAPELVFSCSLKNAQIELQPLRGDSVIYDADISPDEPTCDIDVHAIRCFSLLDKTTCGMLVSKRIAETNYLVVVIPDHTAPEFYVSHQLREVDYIPVEDAEVIAANMAYFSALKFDYGNFNMMYMTLSEVVHDVTLNRTVRQNVSEISVAIAAPVLTIVILSTSVLTVVALTMWIRYVYNKNRRKYTTFSSVEEVLAMVRSEGLTKSKEGDPSDQVIFLQGDRPVLVRDTVLKPA